MPAPTARLTPSNRGAGGRFAWVTLTLVGVSLLASFLPGLAQALQYDRGAAADGQPWRLITGQLVHWTARMTLVDLGMLALLGVWVEWRSRLLLAGTLVTAAALVATGLHLFAREVVVYRGSSGLAAAAFTVVALALLCDGRSRWVWRGLAALALVLLAAKTVWEMREGAALAAGRLPEQVSVTPITHLMGTIAGLAAFAAWSLFKPRPAARA